MALYGSYHPALVLVSYLVAVLASFVALDSAGRIAASEGSASRGWLVAGGVAVNERLQVPAGPGGELPEPFHGLVEAAILASVVDPFDPMEKAFHQLGQRFLADTEHLHHDWQLVQTYALSPALRARGPR